MKLTLKIVVALAVLMAATTAYAEIPDVSKWVCPKAFVETFPEYGVETTDCSDGALYNVYVKISGELVYIHEHRTDAHKTVYYNALKVGDQWIEVVNTKDLIWSGEKVEKGFETNISDDNGNIVAERFVPLLTK